MHRPYWSEVLDHLGLVAGMFDELGIGDVLDRAMQHDPETRLVTGMPHRGSDFGARILISQEVE